MSTSSDRKILEKRATKYLASSVFLVIFNAVYGIFAHGVKSSFMGQAFLVPLVGGVIICLILMLLPFPKSVETSIWRMGIVTIVVGCLLQGVFEIYGTEVSMVFVLFYVGGALLMIAILFYLYHIIFRRTKI